MRWMEGRGEEYCEEKEKGGMKKRKGVGAGAALLDNETSMLS